MITIERLTKRYGTTLAVDDVTLHRPTRRVTGFLGPNGAGKSTTLRIMVGLTRPDAGSATIAGRQYVDLPNPGRRSACCLDASAQHAGRTGRETLTLAQQFMGLPRGRVEEMLEMVSLTPTEASRRVGEYSLGMRQRLGIATALIGDPEVLILDEPANGLDPAGIRWMRDLLRGLRRPRRHRPALLPPAARDRGDRRRHRDDRPGPDRLDGHQDRPAPRGRHRRPVPSTSSRSSWP